MGHLADDNLFGNLFGGLRIITTLPYNRISCLPLVHSTPTVTAPLVNPGMEKKVNTCINQVVDIVVAQNAQLFQRPINHKDLKLVLRL